MPVKMVASTLRVHSVWLIALSYCFKCTTAINYQHGGFKLQADDSGLVYNVTIDGATEWFVSAPSRVHCSAVWYSTNPSGTTDTPLLLENSSINDVQDAIWGQTTVIILNYQASDGFKWDLHFIDILANDGIILFRQQWPNGCSNMNITQPQDPSKNLREFNSTSLPSSEFPSFHVEYNGYLQQQLASITWRGRFSHDKSMHGAGALFLQGGSEGGPVVVFDPQASLSPASAAVLSTWDAHSEGIMAVRTRSHNDQCDCTLAQDVDYSGHDLYWLSNITSVADCCTRCQGEPACSFYTYIPVDVDPEYGGNCYFKNSDAGARPQSGHVSGHVCERDMVFGVQGKIARVDANHTQTFVLMGATGAGINQMVHDWGQALQKQHSTDRVANDLVANYLGYWTDNGGYFYGGNPPNTSDLETLFAGLKKMECPIRYVQLDPFWYPVENYPACASGAQSWTPRPDLYPNGLQPVRDAGWPLLLYAAYYCPDTYQYYPAFNFTVGEYFDVGFARGRIAQIQSDQSFAFFNQTMSHYVDAGLMGAFEVDFMDFNYLTIDQFVTQPGKFFEWAKGMSDAALANHVSIQYCMGLPLEMMTSLTLNGVTTARASEDNFPGNENRWQIGYTSLFYAALGLRPFMDVVWTRGHQPGNPYNTDRDNVELQLMIAVLSNGPVGIGDGIGLTDMTKVDAIARSDGQLLHPSYSATPLDRMYFPGTTRAYELWQAHSVLNVNTQTSLAYSLLAVSVGPQGTQVAIEELWPQSVDGPIFYASTNVSDCIGSKLDSCVQPWNETQPFEVTTAPDKGNEHGVQLYSAMPVLCSRWLVLGDPKAYVPFSPYRIGNITCDNTSLQVGVIGGSNEANVQIVLGDVVHNLVQTQTVTLDAEGQGQVVWR